MTPKNPSGREHHKQVPLVPVDPKSTGQSSNPSQEGRVAPDKTTPTSPVPSVSPSKGGWKQR